MRNAGTPYLVIESPVSCSSFHPHCSSLQLLLSVRLWQAQLRGWVPSSYIFHLSLGDCMRWTAVRGRRSSQHPLTIEMSAECNITLVYLVPGTTRVALSMTSTYWYAIGWFKPFSAADALSCSSPHTWLKTGNSLPHECRSQYIVKG